MSWNQATCLECQNCEVIVCSVKTAKPQVSSVNRANFSLKCVDLESKVTQYPEAEIDLVLVVNKK